MVRITLKTRQQDFQFYPEVLLEDIALEMMLIPEGDFMMGCPEEEDGDSEEQPQHPVQVPSFFMAKTPVTQAQWKIVAQMPKVNCELEDDPAHFKGSNYPVERVSWNDAMEFCDRLSVQTGRFYTLPTEAQWEYACRGGTQTPFSFGQP